MGPVNTTTIYVDSRNHGDPNLACTPASWSSLAVFFFANYIAHCATIKPYPGETISELIVALLLALFFPSSGVIRALDSIFRHSRLFVKEDELQKAVRAGALCMVGRSGEWKPRDGDQIRGLKMSNKIDYTSTSPGSRKKVHSDLQDEEQIALVSQNVNDLEHGTLPYAWRVRAPSWMHENLRTGLPKRSILRRGCKIHGVYDLPTGYDLFYVPSNARVNPNWSGRKSNYPVEISTSYNAAKTMFAVVQTVYAAITLYKARGDQIDLYGYASFGLTVTPYVIMSVLNLIGQLVTPDYPTLFLIHNHEMDEARGRGGYFDGVLGSLCPDTGRTDANHWVVELLERAGKDEPPIEEIAGTKAEMGEAETYGLTSLEVLLSGPVVRDKDAKGFFTFRRIPERTDDGSRSFSRTADQLPLSDLCPRICIQQYQSRDFISDVSIPSCSPFDLIPEQSQDRYPRWSDSPTRKSRIGLVFFAPLAVGSISLLIIGLLTHFHKGQSTKGQRAWTMSWLIVGMIFGFTSSYLSSFLLPEKDMSRKTKFYELPRRLFGFSLTYGIFLAPAIGGFVTVGQMLSLYGACKRID